MQYGFPDHKPNLQGQGYGGSGNIQCNDQTINLPSATTQNIIDSTTTDNAIYYNTEAPAIRQKRSVSPTQLRVSNNDEGKERIIRQQQYS